MTGRVLVLFGSITPAGDISGYDTVIAPRALKASIPRGVAFTPLEDFTDTSSVEEAAEFLGELARAESADGVRVSRSVSYRGLPLWWMHYDELMVRQCLPYTQYKRLLGHLKNFSHVTLYKPPAAGLFSCYLDAHGRRHKILGGPSSVPGFGIWLQVLLSLIFLPWLMIRRPKLMVQTSDLFDPPRDHNFRMVFIYQELRSRKLPFVEFLRSMESARVVIAHAVTRRRAVIYSYAISVVLTWAAKSLFGEYKITGAPRDEEDAFKFYLASLYLRSVRGTTWSVKVMNILVRALGLRAALIQAGSSRSFHEVWGCKLADVPVLGIMHGAASRYYNVYDFMPEYEGAPGLALDVYGMWSPWWREYYLKYSKVYATSQLFVSGPMRPLTTHPPASQARKAGLLKVLFVAEQLAEPGEVMPYLEALLREPDVLVHLKFRSYHDGFETWLREHRPDVMERVGSARVLRGAMQDAIAQCDVVVGSHSTAVLEALLQLKPLVLFHTRKWGDYFGLEVVGKKNGISIYAESPSEFVEYVSQAVRMPRQTLEELQEMFFGEPHRNGSAWLVDQAEKKLREH